MKTKTVKIGSKVIGGGNPILIQSMTNTKTEDIAATVAQINKLAAAGCDIIRCAVPTMEAAEALTEIKKQVIRSVSIRETSEAESAYRRSWMRQKSGRSRFVSVSTVVL